MKLGAGADGGRDGKSARNHPFNMSGRAQEQRGINNWIHPADGGVRMRAGVSARRATIHGCWQRGSIRGNPRNAREKEMGNSAASTGDRSRVSATEKREHLLFFLLLLLSLFFSLSIRVCVRVCVCVCVCCSSGTESNRDFYLS